MPKKYKGYEDIKDIDVSTAESKVEEPHVYRTLFIGLGGTGGSVLCKLSEMMSDEEKEHAHIIYMDMDAKDVRALKARGMNAVSLSSSDTVRSVMTYLGENDGVKDWLPHGPNDNEFLSSKTDDGASQYRIKSRLCMAKYLSDSGSEFNTLLDSICAPGSLLSNETLRVMIVSSVAGGTGAGTFIQVALYLRDYFRNSGHKDISIMGLFACPDLFVRASSTDKRNITAKKENMYANAYAAIRELNAMNLAVNMDANARKAEGYGKNINISINTKSEGPLFDSNDPKLAENANNKPFNLLYFVDVNNTEGGVLKTLEQYYDVMADIVYTRLYSPIEGPLRSDENNELSIHSRYPTAIYGSAGYGRIIYPYHGILNYLSVRRTYDELDYTWSIMENEWEKHKRNQQMIANAAGSIWTETTEERGKKYVSDMTDLLDKPNSRIRGLKGMVRQSNMAIDRAEEFLERLTTAMDAGNGIDTTSITKDSIFGLNRDEAVSKKREDLAKAYDKAVRKQKNAKKAASALNALRSISIEAKKNVEEYAAILNAQIAGRAVLIASQIAPRTDMDGKMADAEKSNLNLFHGLLSVNGRAVHPLAARYLLYRLRDKMQQSITDAEEHAQKRDMLLICKGLELALDEDNKDGKDTTVDMRIKEIEKSFFLTKGYDAREALDKYIKKYASVVDSLMRIATQNLQNAVYKHVLQVVDLLIAQYEGLFDNLQQYRNDLALRLHQEQVRHESASDNRCIYINASREAKEYLYSGDMRTREILQKGGTEIDAAAGKGIYDALIRRTWAIIDREEKQVITHYNREEEKDTFSDLGDVFTSVMRIYRDYLEKNAGHLNMSVVEAIVGDICQSMNLTSADLTDHTNRVRVHTKFSAVMKDMIDKAKPMLNFDFENRDTYYEGEDQDSDVISTTLYMHLGLSPEQMEDLVKIYGGTTAKDALASFENEFHPSRGATISTDISPYEMVCFQAVHCLQPTQIHKFHEDNVRGYYPYYISRLKKMVNDRQMSETPHLDKRWHLREAMPYISRSMEQKWLQKTAKAFINELLDRKFRFTTDSDGITCFTYKQSDKAGDVHVYWPEDRLVTINDISRLMEFLQDQDSRVERLVCELDEHIADITERLSKYTENMATYKAAMTNNELLTDLRSNLLVRKHRRSTTTAAHGKNATIATEEQLSAEQLADLKQVSGILGTSDLDKVDMESSKGGILNIAWLIHKSEERQRRDNDFGEALIKCCLDIVDKLCLNMFSTDITRDSNEYPEYRDLYNSILEKFMESFVAGILSKLKLLDPQQLENCKTVQYHRYLKIPEIITETEEFEWVSGLWKLKK